jgi:hypothetical protein
MEFFTTDSAKAATTGRSRQTTPAPTARPRPVKTATIAAPEGDFERF